MKSYTDLEQSRKLAEFLPLESADMYYEERCNLPKAIVGSYSLHIMDYEKAYRNALEKARQFSEHPLQEDSANIVEYIFPELAESEDEQIRKTLIEMFSNVGKKEWRNIPTEKIIAWLEKQGEQKPSDYENATIIQKDFAPKVKPKFKVGDVMRTLQEAADGMTGGMPVIISVDEEYYHCTNELIAIKDQDEYEYPPMNRRQKPTDKVAPKFHEGDWIVDNQGLVHQIERVVENVTTHTFGYDIVGGGYFNDESEGVHLWSIQDAKDGDVLVCESKHGQEIGIVKKYIGKYGGCDKCFETYCYVDWDGIFRVCEYMGSRNIHPATKEQRDILFAKMHEAGYEWDAEKKELRNANEFNCGGNPREIQ